MSFLAPLFLLGALAVSAPIVFHLIRRSARERTPFSSLMFLRPEPPRATRRRRLEHPWLLLLRCLCLCLLALGFARPFLSKSTPPATPSTPGRQILLLVDTSASMRRDNAWTEARAIASRYINGASAADQVALVTFDRAPHTVFGFADWLSWDPANRADRGRQHIEKLAPGWMATDLASALTAAAEQFAIEEQKDSHPARRELVVISDLQEGARLDGLQGFDWPPGLRVALEPVDLKPRSNAGIEVLPLPATAARPQLRVRVTNDRDADSGRFTLAWASRDGGPLGAPVGVDVPAGEARMITPPDLPAGTTTAQLQLSGDGERFDNISWFAAPETERLSLAWMGNDAPTDPSGLRYYFEHAFPSQPRREVRWIDAAAQRASRESLDAASFAVVAGPLDSAQAAATHDWLASGKSGLLVLADPAMTATLESISGLHGLQVSEAAGDFALLGSIDFTHPLFAPFADPRFSDFSRIHFWKHRLVEWPTNAPVQCLARFDDGSPALAEMPVGKGRLVVLTAGWQPSQSQFAVSSKFLPLMQVLVDWAGRSSPVQYQCHTGDTIPSPATGAGTVEWRLPDGRTQMLAGGTAFEATFEPGIYTAAFDGRERRFAVNVPSSESRTAPLLPDELARRGVPLNAERAVAAGGPGGAVSAALDVNADRGQRLWRWCIAGALVAVLADILIGGWLGRPVQPAERVS